MQGANTFPIGDIREAPEKAIAIEIKNHKANKSEEKVKAGKKDRRKEGKSDKGESTKRKNRCEHCKILLPELQLQPKDRRQHEDRKGKKATLAAHEEVVELTQMTEPNERLILMAGTIAYPNSAEDSHREELFHLNVQEQKSLIETIIDPGSQKNLISEAIVKKLGIQTSPLYALGWIKKY